jgi:hypothetical protein
VRALRCTSSLMRCPLFDSHVGAICKFDCCIQCRSVPFVPPVVTFSPPGFCKIMVTFDDGRAPEVLSTDSGGKFDVKKFRQSACSFQPMTMTEPALPLGGKFRLQLPLVKEETHEVNAVVAKQQFKYKDQPMAECEATGIFTHADGRITTISARTDAQGCVPLLLPQGCITNYEALTTVIAADGKTQQQIVVPAQAFNVPARAPESAACDAVVTCTVAKDSSRIEFLSFCKGTHIIFLADTSGSMGLDSSPSNPVAKLEVLKRTLRKSLDEVPNCRQSIALQAWNTTPEWFRSKLPVQQPLSARVFSKSVPNELCDMILGGAGDLFQDPVIAADGNTCAIHIYISILPHLSRVLLQTLSQQTLGTDTNDHASSPGSLPTRHRRWTSRPFRTRTCFQTKTCTLPQAPLPF